MDISTPQQSVQRNRSSKTAQAGRKRLRLLVGALLACAVALPVTRYLLLRKPTPPASTASADAQRAYWQQRIQADVSDVEAYVRLGIVEERAGFYMSAVKHLRAARALGAADAQISAPLGRALTQLARDDEALPELEKAAKLAPQSIDAAANLAGLYINQGDTDSAALILEKFVQARRATGTKPAANELERLALAFMESGDNASAREMADLALKDAPDNLIARSVAARAALTEKKYAAAQEHLETMLRQSPNDAAVLYLYGIALEAQGKRDAALKQWQRAVALNPAAIDAYEKIGTAYARQGDLRRAAVALEVVARSERSKESAARVAGALAHIKAPDSEEKGRVAYWQAVAAGYMGDFPRAAQLAKQAAANPATHRQGLFALAEAYRGMRKKELYLDTMRQATAGGSVDDLLIMAQAYDQADEHARREDVLKRALAKAVSPQQKTAIRVTLAQAYRGRGMRDEAEQELEKAAQESPDPAADIYRQLGAVLFERRTEGARLEKAIRAYETAISLDPTQQDDWQKLGSAYMAQGNIRRAIQCFEHAIDLEPGYGAAYLELGRAYARLGDKDSSKRALDLYSRFVAYDQERQTLSARARRPNPSADDLVAYGDFLRKTGFTHDAVTQYEMALALRPGDKSVQAKRDALYRRLRMNGIQVPGKEMPSSRSGEKKNENDSPSEQTSGG